MATLKCSDMGGPCDTEITADTAEEMVAKGTAHVKEAHPEMVADMEAMTPEAKEAWKKEHVDPAFAQAPEAPAEEDVKEVEII